MLRHTLRGRLERLTVQGACLRGNLLGDPTTRELVAYLPPTYDGARRFPVVYLLPGYPSTARSLAGDDVWKPNVFELFDRLLAEGRVTDAIVVAVDASTSFGGSQYLDSPALGAYQSFLAEDVIPAVDRALRTVPMAAARAVAGRSSGGFGALRLAMDRPGLVAAVASHAGDMGFEVSLRPMFAAAATAYAAAGGVAAFAERLRAEGPRSGSEYDPAFFLVAACAYGGATELPFPHARLPFDLETLELDEPLWRAWCASDPVERVARAEVAAALRALRFLYLDAGSRDEYALQYGARRFVAAAARAMIPVTYEEFEGGHRGTSHRFEASLPRLVAALSPAE